MDERVDEIVAEIEAEKELGRISGAKIFKSLLNQPSLVGVRSCDGEYEAVQQGQYNSTAFNSFTINLQRPCLDVDGIQLTSANIPQAQTNIPDTACVFWYYRTSEYNSRVPTINNLLYNRLLPSYYKPEFITNPSGYAFNRTFKNYKDLSTETVKAGIQDLCYYNWQNDTDVTASNDYVPFIPNDISISLDTAHNKFSCVGANVNVPPTYLTWVTETVYSVGQMVKYGSPAESYVSLVNANTGQQPDISPLKWRVNTNELMANWDENAYYSVGDYVAFNNSQMWKCLFPNRTRVPEGVSAYQVGRVYSQFQIAFSPLVNINFTYVNQIPSATIDPSLSLANWYQTEWLSLATYPQGFVGSYDNVFYVCLQTNSGHRPDLSPTFWEVITFWTPITTPAQNIWNRYLIAGYADPNVAVAQGTAFEYQWDSNYLYEAGATIGYNSRNYTSVIQNRQPPQLNLWTPNKAYVAGNEVLYSDGNNYRANASNINTIPRVPQLWVSTTAYVLNDIVLVSTTQYRCIQVLTVSGVPVPAPSPPNATYWQSQGTYTQKWDRIANTATAPLPSWEATKNYNIGDQILYTGGATNAYFQAIQSGNINRTPSTSTSWWVPIQTIWQRETDIPPLSAGLNYLSSVYDMMGTDGTDAITFPPRIPSQPFNPNPRRLLNSVLGFTWNGVFNTSTLPAFNTVATEIIPTFLASVDAPLMNRFRPVPFYEVRPDWSPLITYPLTYVVRAPDGLYYKSRRNNNLNHEPSVSPIWWADDLNFGSGLGSIQNSASTTGTYLADSYCNLVYSSLISIYANIVGASSSDSARNTNLIGIAPMSCGNLGIAFTNQFLEQPLTKIGGDIFRIYIELRDEFDEPYYLSNNAVCSLTLKIKYKDEIKPLDTT